MKKGKLVQCQVDSYSHLVFDFNLWYNIHVEYKISIKMGDYLMEGVGKTALEALQSIPRPLKINQKGVLKITKGKKSKEMVFYVQKLRRLFFPRYQPLLVKWLLHGIE